MQLVNIGFGNIVSAERIVAIVSPESAPIKRLIQESKDNKTTVDGLLASKSDNINTLTDIVLLNDGTINLKYVGDE